MKTKLLITAIFSVMLICIFAFGVSASTCTGEHSYDYQVELGEEGFFGEITLNGVCTSSACYSKTQEKISPIFVYRGYSYGENGYTDEKGNTIFGKEGTFNSFFESIF